MHLGIEVEGKYKGIKTLFISADELWMIPLFFEKYAHQAKEIKQLYISDHANELDIRPGSPVLLYKERFDLITVERTACAGPHDAEIHVMLVVEHSDFWALLETDQIKFTRNHYVWAITKGEMHKSIPQDFEGDKEVQL